MEHRTLELNLTSAKDLKDLNLFGKMDVYAVVSVSGDPRHHQKAKTPVDKLAGTNPSWNFPIKFTFNESLARQNRLTVEIKLRCVRAFAADGDIGNVHVPLKELLDQIGDGKSFQHVSYQVRKPSGKPKGVLNFSYKFGEKPAPSPVNHKAGPVTAYPAPAMGSAAAPKPNPAAYPPPPPPPLQYPAEYGYPYGGYPQSQAGYYGYPQQTSYGYGYPPQPGYGYPPPPPPPVQRPAKNNFGMGLGAGLLGGALGGLLIGDMISDGAGYDAGFGDMGGFGF